MDIPEPAEPRPSRQNRRLFPRSEARTPTPTSVGESGDFWIECFAGLLDRVDSSCVSTMRADSPSKSARCIMMPASSWNSMKPS